MNSSIFSAAKCLTCGMPKMTAVGNRILSAMQQSSTLLRARPMSGVNTAGTRLLSSAPSAQPVIPQSSLVAKSGAGNVPLTFQTNTFSSRLTGPAPAHASLLSCSTPTIMQTRGRAETYYKPSAWKRVNKHGLEKRLRTPGGIEVLWRRILKKRHCLTPFDRIVPGTYNGQILPDHHLKYNKHLVNREVRKRVQQTLRKK